MSISRLAAAALTGLVLFSSAASAAISPRHGEPRTEERERTRPSRHLLLRAEHALLPEERVALEIAGCKVLREAGGSDYIVAVNVASREEVAAKPFVASLTELPRDGRILPSARREAARFGERAQLNIIFHEDVAFERAQDLIRSAGGWIVSPLETGFRARHSLQVSFPDDAIDLLAAIDEVFLVEGPMPPIKAANATAAAMSAVTPVHSWPYGLTGAGVVVSVFDYGDTGPALADGSHIEFGGRIARHGAFGSAFHPTHVIGTIAARGIHTPAKGMAPGVRVENYAATDGFLDDKEDAFAAGLTIRADNNSWGFVHGWENIGGAWAWYGGTQDDPATTEDERLTDALFGEYGSSAAALDQISREKQVLIVFASSNDNVDGGPAAPCYEHRHEVQTPRFCYTETGEATTSCTAAFCTGGFERVRHKPDGPFGTVNLVASSKNSVTVGGVTPNKQIAPFSARGPARDGRLKPEVVARGYLFSTIPGNGYTSASGTSMSAPVVTGISALLIEQWRKSMGGEDPTPEVLRVLLVHGAEDLGNAGPDFSYGYGLVNAQNSVETIIADSGSGSHIRQGTVSQGQTIEYALTMVPRGEAKLTLGWMDPEALPYPGRALVNDLDLKVIAPDGSVVLPLVLDPAQPELPAVAGVNRRDNLEQITFTAATAGLYRVQVSGTHISTTSPQTFSLASSASLGPLLGGCVDPFEPNDTIETAFGRLGSGATINARICTATDVDFYRFVVDRSGPVSVTVAPSVTAVRVTLLANGNSVQSVDVAAGSSRTIQTSAGTGFDAVITPITHTVRIEPLSSAGSYSLTVKYRFAGTRQRGARR